MPNLKLLTGGEDGGILDIQGNKSIGIIHWKCPHCGYTWIMDIRRNILNTQFKDWTWSLDDCTHEDGTPGAKIFRAEGDMECPSCLNSFFQHVEAHEQGGIHVTILSGDFPYAWWEVESLP